MVFLRGLAAALIIIGLASWRLSSIAPQGSSAEPAPGEEANPSGPPGPPGLFRVGAEGAELASVPGGDPAGRIGAGVILPFEAVSDGWLLVLTPCENQGWLPMERGEVLGKYEVVIDPGHGGNEIGAVGPGGLTEKELNLDVARRTVDLLDAEGIPAALTRSEDYRATLAFRAALSAAAGAEALVSVHHNAMPEGRRDGPGTEIFHQFHSPDSKRLGGLVYEETVAALSPFPADWAANHDAGVKWRLTDRGGDYYGILRRPASLGVTSVLAEMAFITNPTEEDLLRREEVRSAQASALSAAVGRYFKTEDPGSGFVVPSPARGPAGPGGGTTGCIDPQ